jgi:hypothetical protein
MVLDPRANKPENLGLLFSPLESAAGPVVTGTKREKALQSHEVHCFPKDPGILGFSGID